LRAALQALAACGGAAAGGSANCTSAALGASASVALNLLLDAIDKEDRTVDSNGDGNSDDLTLESEQARTNLIATLTGILAQSVGADASAAVLAATIETENNELGGQRFSGSCGPTSPVCRAISPQDYQLVARIVRLDAQGRPVDAQGNVVEVRFVDGRPIDQAFIENSLSGYQSAYRSALNIALSQLNPGYISQEAYEAAIATNSFNMYGGLVFVQPPTPVESLIQPTNDQITFILSASNHADLNSPHEVRQFLQYYGGLQNISTDQNPAYYGAQWALAYKEGKDAFERFGVNRLVALNDPNNTAEFLNLSRTEYLQLQQAYDYAANTGQLPRSLSTAERISSGIDSVGNFVIAGLLTIGTVGTAPACATVAGCLVPIGFGGGAAVSLDAAITRFNEARTGYSQQSVGGYVATRIFRVNADTGEVIYLGAQIAGGVVTGGRASLNVRRTITEEAPRPRTLEQLAPNGQIPTISSGNFNQWFDGLSVEEFRILWANPQTRSRIEERLRSPGGFHEWCMVCRAPTFKEWNVPASEISRFRTRIEDLTWTVPGTNQAGRHGGLGSTTFHNELAAIIDSSRSLNEFNQKLPDLLRRWNIDPSKVPPLPRGS
jgi:hypothetical protein